MTEGKTEDLLLKVEKFSLSGQRRSIKMRLKSLLIPSQQVDQEALLRKLPVMDHSMLAQSITINFAHNVFSNLKSRISRN